MRALGRLAAWLFVLATLEAVAHWSWQQPFMAKPRTLLELSRMPAPEALAVPAAAGAARGRRREAGGRRGAMIDAAPVRR